MRTTRNQQNSERIALTTTPSDRRKAMFVAPLPYTITMTHPSSPSENLPTSPQYGRASTAPLISEEDEQDDNVPAHVDAFENRPITRIQTSDEGAFQQDIPQPLTGFWRLYSDQVARESVLSAQQKHQNLEALVDTHVETIPDNSTDGKVPAALKKNAKREKSTDSSFTEEPPVVSKYGKTTKKPLIDDDDDDDESDEEEQEKKMKAFVNNRNMTGAEENIQTNLPQAFTGLWRNISDMIAREGVQNANQSHDEAPSTSLAQAAGILETTADSLEDDERPIFAAPDDRRYRSGKEYLGEEGSYTSSFLLQDTLSGEEQRETATTPYLDPDLVRRAHARTDTTPKTTHVSSDRSLQDAPQHLSIHGSKKQVKKGMVELNPGEFVRVHGKRHAQSAIEKGQSIIVKCDSCNSKFQVDRKAGSLYCTQCKSVTRLGSNGKKNRKHSRLMKSI